MRFEPSIEIRGKQVGQNIQPYIIAEMACAHNGAYESAKELINVAHKANADAVQLQFFVPEHTVTPHHQAFSVLQEIAFSVDEWTSLFEYGRQVGIDVWVCTYDVPSVELAVKLGADGIKLNSADLSNPEVIISVAKSGIPFTVGTGASTLEEISRGLHTAYDNGARKVILMHGVQNFPTEIDNLNISRIRLLQDVFEDIPVGYADHTNADDEMAKVIDLVAIGLGANLIEKHICLSRSEKGIDYQAALEPDEFADFVSTIRTGARAFGSKQLKSFTESDLKYRKFQKKSIVADRDIEVGETITRDNVIFLRNEDPGVPPIQLDLLEGKCAKYKISRHDNITANDVQ